MKEILRLTDAEQQGPKSAALRSYHLEIFAGEIVVVYGLAGSGMNGLIQFLSGRTGLTGGRIEILEEPAPLRRDDGRLWNRIYLCGDIRNQFENLTVAENLDLFSRNHSLHQVYDRAAAVERARRYLTAEGVEIDPETTVGSLPYPDRICLNLLQAKMAHAALVVIDSTKYVMGAQKRSAAVQMVHRLSSEGMAFLILTYREDAYSDIASRFQRISYGTDVMEWDRGAFSRRSAQKTLPEEQRPGMEGIRDELVNYLELTFFLEKLKQENPEFWETHLHFSVPKRGMCSDGQTVLIPRESAWLLAENMSVADNLILPIPKRVAGGIPAYIPPRIAASAAEAFCEATGIGREKKRIRDLTLVERKILSVYRWAQDKPRTIVLQSPHFGMDRIESRVLDDYLRSLSEKGIRVILLSGSMQNLKRLCRKIIVTDNACCARILEEPTGES